jgi:dTDP-4-amino-4,6-dideoxygalactose transaminase
MKKFNKPILVTKPILPSLDKYREYLDTIWESGILSNKRQQHWDLEKALLKYLKVENLTLFNNGTTALITALQALRITGKCITTPYTFMATVNALHWNNIEPIFCDIDPITFNIDADKIEELITPDTTCILPVHIFGNPCDVYKIKEIADKHGLKVIYDAAHAFGVEIDNIGIGNFGDIIMYSFHPTKLFHTGEGGALTCKDKNLKQRLEYLNNFGIKDEETIIMPGINGKMNEMSAALGLLVLEEVEQHIQKRKILTELYIERLKDIEGISFLNFKNNVKRNYQYMIIRIPINKKDDEGFVLHNRFNRDYLYDKLKEYNIFTRKYFYPLCSNFIWYKHLHSNVPIAEQISKETLCLPLYGDLSENEVNQICDIIIGILNDSCIY